MGSIWKHRLVGPPSLGREATLRRAGLEPVAAEPGRAGQQLWDAGRVRAAAAARPGRGYWRKAERL